MSVTVGLIVCTGLVTTATLAALVPVAHRFTTPRRARTSSAVRASPPTCRDISLQARVDGVRLGALVTDSTYADLYDVLRLQFRRLTNLPQCLLCGALLAARALTGVSMLQSAPALRIAGRRGFATLVIHAADDPFVPVSHARALAARAECQLWITAGSKHLSSYGVEGRVYLETVATFFSRHLHAPLACTTVPSQCWTYSEPQSAIA
jgi:pimeloyl-ACP methyl ester carboxylesterase